MRGKTKNRSTKLHLVFDEQKRREFLTGFHKRKVQRKQRAKEQLDKDLKEERKRLRLEAKESYKKLVKSYEPIPEIEQLLNEKFEDEEVTVKVLELSTHDIARRNNWIGSNHPVYETNEAEEEDVEEDDDDIPGMGVKKTTSTKPRSVKQEEAQPTRSKKDIKKLLKRQATKKVQQSKVFQVKNKLEKQKQRKKSKNEKILKEKNEKKFGKKRKGRKGK